MPEERFVRLVEENGGFEFYQAYANDVDHVLGGKGDTCWYVVMKKGKTTESWVGKLSGGVWEDTYTKGAKTKSMPSGTTIALIEEKAYLMQDEKWVKDRKPKPVEDAHPRFHYVYGFGDRAVDVSQEYGVTIAFSDIRDPAAGFHLRYLYTGNDVELP